MSNLMASRARTPKEELGVWLHNEIASLNRVIENRANDIKDLETKIAGIRYWMESETMRRDGLQTLLKGLSP